MLSSATLKAPSELSSGTVNIYLRNYKKIAKLVTVPSPIASPVLAKFVAGKHGTTFDKLALFYNGQRIDLSSQSVELKEKSIVHVVELIRTHRPEMTVLFKFPGHPQELLQITTNSKFQVRSVFETISNFFGKGEKEVFFGYLGRPVNIFRSFEEQLIEDGCELLVLQFKKVQVRQFETINHSVQIAKKDLSFASTKMLDMPAMGGRSISVLNAKKANKGGMQTSIKDELAPLLQKLEIKDGSTPGESAAPYQGFDPHFQSAAPMQKMETAPSAPGKITKQANSFTDSTQQQSMNIKQKDLLYLAYPAMQQTENFIAGAAQQYKNNFLKKQSSGKQNKK